MNNKSMNIQCQSESRTTELCCPGDEKLRKKWLLTLKNEHIYTRDKSTEITGKLKILSNSNRVEILLMLGQREHCMDEVVRKLNARKSAVSYHLGMLIKHDMVLKRRSRFAFYSLSQAGKNAIAIIGNL